MWDFRVRADNDTDHIYSALSNGVKIRLAPAPAPKPDPQPSQTPQPTGSPTPSPSASPEALPTSSPTPSPSPSPEPTPQSSPSPSPSASIEPAPQITPSPTPEPSQSPVPSISPSPNPTPQPDPTPPPAPSFPENSVHATGDEWGEITLSAPQGSVFTQVYFANYGLPIDYHINSECSADVTSYVAGAFIGKNTATVGVTNTDINGDPCYGIGKHMSIVLVYGPAPIVPPVDPAPAGPVLDPSPDPAPRPEPVVQPPAVEPAPQPAPEPEPAPAPEVQPAPEPAPDPAPEPEPEPAPAPDPQPEPAPEPEPAPDPAPAPDPQPAPAPDPAPLPEPAPEPAPAPEPLPAPDPAPEPPVVEGLIPNSPDQLPEDTPKEAPKELLVPHIQEDKPGVENGGIEFFGTKSQPQVVQEDGTLTPPPPLPGSGDPIPPDAITISETFIGQPGGVTFNAPDIAVPVELVPVEVPAALDAIPGAGEAIQAVNQAYVALANIGNDMSPITRKKAKKILVATIVASGISQLRRRF